MSTRVEGFTKVAAAEDVAPGTMHRVELEDFAICIVNTEGELYALRDNCSHKDFPLSEGELIGHTLTCDWHGARFDVTSGKALSLPAIKPVQTYKVKVEDGEIWVKV